MSLVVVCLVEVISCCRVVPRPRASGIAGTTTSTSRLDKRVALPHAMSLFVQSSCVPWKTFTSAPVSTVFFRNNQRPGVPGGICCPFASSKPEYSTYALLSSRSMFHYLKSLSSFMLLLLP